MIESKENLFHSIENWISIIILGLIVLLLIIEIIGRTFFLTGIPNSSDYIKHLVLWITFISAMITSREKKHLSLNLPGKVMKDSLKKKITIAISFIAVTICTVFTITSVRFIIVGFDLSKTVGILPILAFLFIIPLGFLFITFRFISGAGKTLQAKLISAAGILLGIFFSIHSIFFFIQDISILITPDDFTLFEYYEGIIENFNQFYMPFISIIFWPCIILLIVSAFLGTPIFIILGGMAVLCFLRAELPLGDIQQEAYGVLIRNEIPAIPLFTLTGFLLSESKAGERFVRLFRNLLGWLPGGLAIVVVIVCAIFTTLTGASGVTILALGGFLSTALIKRNYKKDFSYGLLTGSGSIGLLFPPALPVILYGVAATISIRDLYVGGFLPGILLVITLCIMGIVHAVTNKIERIPFKGKEVLKPLLASLPELLLPALIFISFFSGFTTLVETGAITVVYVFIIEVFVYKDIKIKDLPKIIIKGVPIIGGILIIMGIARGFAYYIIDQQIPDQLTAWCTTYIQSPWIFLILLNIGLLITGCFLDIFSAIFVVAPLIIPLGVVYEIHPVHLGIIFLANLQLGYLTPPVGLNLFLASYRFNQPLTKLYKQVLPFFLASLVAVLLITYVAPFTTMFLEPVRNPGEAWLKKEQKAVRAGDSFFTEIHVDTGDQKLAHYEIRFEYDPEIIQVNTTMGNNGIDPAGNGFVSVVEIPGNGVLVAKGEDTGKYPSRDLHLITIHWTAQKKGKTKINIDVFAFLDEFGDEIGNYRGGLFKIGIK
ncbi:MAG: TRAP transporter large permease subunit [Spirochaetales bacterium]|nr:TRAP transporter large permease subunit [Spirochaetales bacterium]